MNRIARIGVLARALCGAFGLLLCSSVSEAEPSLLVYPSTPCVFRFDPGRYEVVSVAELPADAQIDGVNSVTLWDKFEQRVPVEVYRAPNLIGFEPSADGRSEFVTVINQFVFNVDGFAEHPRQLHNLYMRIVVEPSWARADVTIDGVPVTDYIVPLQSLVVSTQLENGYYSDKFTHWISWRGAIGLRLFVYSDKDGDKVLDGEPLFCVYSQDNTIPVVESSWGRVKALYQD